MFKKHAWFNMWLFDTNYEDESLLENYFYPVTSQLLANIRYKHVHVHKFTFNLFVRLPIKPTGGILNSLNKYGLCVSNICCYKTCS